MKFPDNARINSTIGIKNKKLHRSIKEVAKRIIKGDHFTLGELAVILAKLKKLNYTDSRYLALGGTWSRVFIERALDESISRNNKKQSN